MSTAVPYGNVYDKYSSRHPLEALLVRHHLRVLSDLMRRAAPARVLEVGCGDAALARRLVSEVLPRGTRYLATDLSATELDRQGDRRVSRAAMDAGCLGLRDRAIDLVLAFEVLEHLDRPEAALVEAARVARGHVIVSVPWEPLWRLGNLARGRYWRELGNTPGHVQHFNRRRIRALVSRHLEIVELRQPLPWTVILARVR